ncbi:MAG: pantoate--beta-alanine ligase [Chloroflexota bacterium]
MKVLETKAALREALAAPRHEGRTIGLVPTMGFLHAGHISLIERARADCDVVVMSLFVNPTQFAPGEDLESYPRDRERDEHMAAEGGADLIYAPAVEEMYPAGFATTVEVDGLTEILCGEPESRGPEHFSGVTTVVAKLLNTVGPDVAYFGQKDAQQAIVIRRMASDLDFPTRIEVCPTIRESDGLALSSRNAYLKPADRERAPALNKALQAAAGNARPGAATADAIAAAHQVLADAGIEPEYVEARDAERLAPIETFNGRPVLLALAAHVGGARLIDNVIIEPEAPSGTAGAAREDRSNHA